MADPDLELRGLGRFVLLALPVFLPSVISSFFAEIRGRGIGSPAPPLDPTLVTYFKSAI